MRCEIRKLIIVFIIKNTRVTNYFFKLPTIILLLILIYLYSLYRDNQLQPFIEFPNSILHTHHTVWCIMALNSKPSEEEWWGRASIKKKGITSCWWYYRLIIPPIIKSTLTTGNLFFKFILVRYYIFKLT